jgi:hypothetical protein
MVNMAGPLQGKAFVGRMAAMGVHCRGAAPTAATRHDQLQGGTDGPQESRDER